jgi:hypothetical protein
MADAKPEVEVDTHRVSLAGQVFGPDGSPAADARVTLTAYPPAFAIAVETRRKVKLSPIEETGAAPDGIFFFSRLPPGKYTVSAVSGGRGQSLSASQEVEVGAAGLASVELKLNGK